MTHIPTAYPATVIPLKTSEADPSEMSTAPQSPTSHGGAPSSPVVEGGKMTSKTDNNPTTPHGNTPPTVNDGATAGVGGMAASMYVATAFLPRTEYTTARKQTTMSDYGASVGPVTDSINVPTPGLAEVDLRKDDEGAMGGTNQTDDAPVFPPLPLIDTPSFVLEPLSAIPPEADISDSDIRLLHKAHHPDPFAILGPHLIPSGVEGRLPLLVVRFWRKDVKTAAIRPVPNHHFTYSPSSASSGGWHPMFRRDEWLFQICFQLKATHEAPRRASIFEINIERLASRLPFFYETKIDFVGDKTGTELVVRDAYNFGLVTPDFDLKHFQAGSCWHVDNLMGSHRMRIEGADGVRFSVWAPSAQFVSVVGDWNQWDGRAHPMRRRVDFGVWELFVPNIGPGEKYGYRIHSKTGADAVKIDPYAQEFENPPATASIISSCDDAYKPADQRFVWTDDQWMARRQKMGQSGEIHRIPISIYEVHLPSWMRGNNNSYLSYREMADRLVKHVKALNFTHVEFLPLAHHPFEGSWGYQVSGQYAPYSRLGNPDDLKYLVNVLHANDIGVFIDFVPAHFVKDVWGLARFDGEPCYEYADPREGEHKGWGTLVYNFRRNEVRSYLLGAAYHWLRRYHVDGLRIDAVSSMIYKNHCKEPGEWIPNEFGGDANLQAISLLQELNWVVGREFPGVFTMAEESTSWKGVTSKDTGLGFDAKWDLGWMNDSLAYLCTPATLRHTKHDKLTFRGLYVANENWVLPLSHDEVVSGKGSLLDKCGFRGSPFEERLKTLRTLYGYQVGLPGRPLLFMGGEFGQGREWNESRSLDWHEAKEELRSKTMLWVSELLKLYRDEPALHAGDEEPWNFQWTDCDNAKDNLIAWLRKFGKWYNDILLVCNFSGQAYTRYPIGVPHGREWTVLLNSDDWRYGGSMTGPGNGTKLAATQGGRLGWPYCLWVDVPCAGCLVIKAPQPTEAEKRAEEEGGKGESIAATKASGAKSEMTMTLGGVAVSAGALSLKKNIDG